MCKSLEINVYFLLHRYIKMSSPNLNNLIIIGCILVYIAGMLFGLKKEDDSIICQVFNNQLLQKATHIPVYKVPFLSVSLLLKGLSCTYVLLSFSLIILKTRQSIKKNQ